MDKEFLITTNNNINDQVQNTSECISKLNLVSEVPSEYQSIFSNFVHFNKIQSTILNTALYSDESIVVSAPTGSGKTTIFELTIVRYLIKRRQFEHGKSFKIVYVAPVKALCEERLIDWHAKFSKFGLTCICITGDSNYSDYPSFLHHDLIITTPEKWDSITRRWQDNKQLVPLVKLFMVDEVHMLNDANRGPTLEVVVSRMKTMQTLGNSDNGDPIRFVAVSATIPNPEDVADWLRSPQISTKSFKFEEEMRPVKLNKIVIGYNYKSDSPFKFDIMMNYRLQNIMMQYADGKPTLIFCSTRRSAEMTAHFIAQNLTMNLENKNKETLRNIAICVVESKIKTMLENGICYHHAGLLTQDRSVIENLFRNSLLPVLVTTSTLAMGVNLPAHLVIIKSTKYYNSGSYQDYSEYMLLQMIGRAGRPQYDTSATAVILTSEIDKKKIENMVDGKQHIESSLHKYLIEHLNAEIVLRTITDLGVAMEWLTSTFLYIRARKNPRYYGLASDLTPGQINRKLLEMCQIEINRLAGAGMIDINQNDITISITSTGSLMAKYCIAFETMKLFIRVTGKEMLQQILDRISKSQEFSEIYLRVNDKKTLNVLNKCGNREIIRFPLNGKIKTVDMKINCIIQAILGCLPILDPSLINESEKIMRIGERISKCLVEYLETKGNCYSALLSALILAKCFHARLWENSPYISKQLSGIGSISSSTLVNAQKTAFIDLLKCNPRDLERILHRKPPIGNKIQDEVRHLPNYDMIFDKILGSETITINLKISLLNADLLKSRSTINTNSSLNLLVGDAENNILLYEKYSHSYFINNPEVIKTFNFNARYKKHIKAHLISEEWVGIDCNVSLNLCNTMEVSLNSPSNTKFSKNLIKTKSGSTSNKKSSPCQTFINMYFNQSKAKNIKSNQIKLTNNVQYQDPTTLTECYQSVGEKLNCSQNNEIALKTISSTRNSFQDLASQNCVQEISNQAVEQYTTKSTSPIIRSQLNNPSINYEQISRIELNFISHTISEETSIVVPDLPNDSNTQEESVLYNKTNSSVFNIQNCKFFDSALIEKYKYSSRTKIHKSSEIVRGYKTIEEKRTCGAINRNMQKSITWRSPLIISPKIKYSPYNFLYNNQNKTASVKADVKNTCADNSNKSSTQLEYSSCTRTNAGESNTKLSTQNSHSRLTVRPNLQTNHKINTLPLSDYAYEKISQPNVETNKKINTWSLSDYDYKNQIVPFSNTEEFPLPSKMVSNNEDDLISTTLLSDLGITTNKNFNLSQVPLKRKDNFKINENCSNESTLKSNHQITKYYSQFELEARNSLMDNGGISKVDKHKSITKNNGYKLGKSNLNNLTTTTDDNTYSSNNWNIFENNFSTNIGMQPCISNTENNSGLNSNKENMFVSNGRKRQKIGMMDRNSSETRLVYSDKKTTRN